MKMRPLPLALLLSLATPPVLADDLLQQAEVLLKAQKPGEAAELLSSVEDQRAGEPAYDYLLGQARLENGDPSAAVFALERCLAAEPNNGPCRVQIARAHLAMGETANARVELNTIRDYNPPPEVQTLVQRYLGAVDTREKQQKQRLDTRVQLGLGHDSNANSATDARQVAMPAFGNAVFDVAPGSRQQDSALLQAAISGSYQNRISPTLTALADAGLTVRSYPDSSDFSTVTLDAGGGAALTRGRHQFIGKLQLQTLQLGGDPFRNLTGLLGQYQFDLAESGRLASWLQMGQLRYDQSDRDANRTTLGGAWSRTLEGRGAPAVFVSVYGGQEKTRKSASDYLGNDFTGLRAGGGINLKRNLLLNGSLSLESRRYDAIFKGNTKARSDDEASLSLGLEWRIAPAVTLVPALMITHNDSNIELTAYDRTVATLDVRFDL